MKSKAAISLWIVLAAMAAVVLTPGCGTPRTLKIDSTPSGATVYLNGERMSETTPLIIPKLPFDQKTRYRIKVEKENYESMEKEIDIVQAKQAVKSSSEPWLLEFALEELRKEVVVRVKVNVPGFALSVNGTPSASPTGPQTLLFTRAERGAEWTKVALKVEKAPNYKAKELSITADEARASNGEISIDLDEIRREVPIDVKANVEAMSVLLDDKEIGVTPLKHTVIFARDDGKAPWSTHTIKLQKENYEHRESAAAAATPFFSRTVTAEDAGKMIDVTGFDFVRFYRTPVRRFEIVGDKLSVLAETNVWSEVSEAARGERPSTPILRPSENQLILTRISVVPNSDKLVFALPKMDTRAGTARTEAEVIGANLAQVAQSGTLTRLTDGRDFAIDPFVVGETNQWIYFSSDRGGTRDIWRMPADGRGGFTKVVSERDSINIEPSVSPDGEKLAYTSRRMGTPDVPQSYYIYVASADGQLRTETVQGRSSAWSSDGKRIAYISPEALLCVMEADRGPSSAQELTERGSKASFPVWAGSKWIVYVSDENLNDQKEHNLDVWAISPMTREKKQLTVNGSLDSAPAISSDKKYLYFFSNRGAKRLGEEALKIWRMELELD